MRIYIEENYIMRTSNDGFDSWYYQAVPVIEASQGNQIRLCSYETHADDTKESKELASMNALDQAKRWLKIAAEKYPA